jgi:protein-tyrosine-phosphatase
MTEASPSSSGPPDGPDRPGGEPFRVLLVCTGNTCRSPMAERLLDAAAGERGWRQLAVASAGVAALPGAPASEGARRVAQAHGLDLEAHRARPLTPQLLDGADLVLAMAPSHLAVLEAMGGGERCALITRFAALGTGDTDPEDQGVLDPFGGDDARYAATWQELQELVEGVVERLAPLVRP